MTLPWMETGAQHRLRAHARRIGADQAAQADPAVHLQVKMLGHLLTIVESAMQDEGVPPATIQRVTDLVIYGGTPNPVEAAERERLTRKLVDHLKTSPAIYRFPDPKDPQ
jgi:hypothetical protein